MSRPARARAADDPAGVDFVKGRGRNAPWIVVGLLLAALGGIGAFVAATTLADRVSVVVAARDLTAGRPLERADLTTVDIGGGDGAKAIPAGRIPSLVGAVAETDAAAGSILHPDQVLPSDQLAGRMVIVGVALTPGQYPLSVLLPGQVVQVIKVSGETSASSDETQGGEVIGEATVFASKALARTDELLVSLRIDQRFAAEVSERAQQRRVRLAIVEPPGTSSTAPPPSTTASTAAPAGPPRP